MTDVADPDATAPLPTRDAHTAQLPGAVPDGGTPWFARDANAVVAALGTDA